MNQCAAKSALLILAFAGTPAAVAYECGDPKGSFQRDPHYQIEDIVALRRAGIVALKQSVPCAAGGTPCDSDWKVVEELFFDSSGRMVRSVGSGRETTFEYEGESLFPSIERDSVFGETRFRRDGGGWILGGVTGGRQFSEDWSLVDGGRLYRHDFDGGYFERFFVDERLVWRQKSGSLMMSLDGSGGTSRSGLVRYECEYFNRGDISYSRSWKLADGRRLLIDVTARDPAGRTIFTAATAHSAGLDPKAPSGKHYRYSGLDSRLSWTLKEECIDAANQCRPVARREITYK